MKREEKNPLFASGSQGASGLMSVRHWRPTQESVLTHPRESAKKFSSRLEKLMLFVWEKQISCESITIFAEEKKRKNEVTSQITCTQVACARKNIRIRQDCSCPNLFFVREYTS